MRKISYTLISLFALAGPGMAGDFPNSALKPVEESVAIRQEAQVRQDNWDAEQQKLAANHQQLTAEADRLEAEQKALEDRLALLTQSVADLEKEKDEMARMASQLEPSLNLALVQLGKIEEHSLAFHQENRQASLQALGLVMADPRAGVEDKFRQVFQALLTEARYGSSIEVVRELIQVEGREIMANVLRLGRLSLFFQTLDQSATGFFDPVANSWIAGPQAFDSGIAHAVDIAAKRRPADIVLLPLGKVAAQ
ncbi:MAG: DUF3450 domain-containing protein [Desulfatibacillum sp.]|nr:DUF3450 domain-containing protein [Desulfatibacillum sp.]